MKSPGTYNSTRGQTSLEYLLLLAVVAVVVIASFGPGSLISKVHDSAQGYYNSVTRVIMGANPNPINGGWCPVTCPSSGGAGPTTIYRSCECPAPAFGGQYCTGANSLTCSGVAATPPVNVTCPTNMYFDTNPSDPGYNTCACIAGTSWNGTGCA